MAKIHGLIYIIVGLFVGIASWRINYEKLYVFFYVGLFLIAFGIAKILIRFITGSKEDKTQKQKSKAIQQKLKSQTRQQFKRCPNCGNIMRAYDNYCSRCGARI